jgi:hypothetical protein
MKALSRNQIPCTAQRLSQLQPEMVQAVVPMSAYAIGHKYCNERRARIVQADETSITSEVSGARGRYQQTIRLADGTLIAQCSCPSTEAPLCRHCVAALLEYIRQSPDADQGFSQKMAPQDDGLDQTTVEAKLATMQEDPVPGQTAASSLLIGRLREVTVFIDWLSVAVNALKTGGTLPKSPALDPGEALEWMQALQKLEARAQQGEEICLALRSELSAKEQHLLKLVHDLESANDRVMKLQAVCEELKLDVERQSAMASRLAEIEQERDKLTGQIKDIASDLVKRTDDLDRLATERERVSGEKQGSRTRT